MKDNSKMESAKVGRDKLALFFCVLCLKATHVKKRKIEAEEKSMLCSPLAALLQANR